MKNSPAVYAALFLGVLAISTSAIFVKFADAPSSAIALYRLGITAAVLLPFLIFSRKRLKEAASLSKRQFALIVASGILLGVHYVMWFESLRYTSIASSIVLVCLQPQHFFSALHGKEPERTQAKTAAEDRPEQSNWQ